MNKRLLEELKYPPYFHQRDVDFSEDVEIIEHSTKIPTKLKKNECLWDIEAVKESVDWEYSKTRFRTIMVGFAWRGKEGNLELTFVASNNEERLYEWLEMEFSRFDTCFFTSTRDFDVNVLLGIWTSYRRSFAPEPGPFPNLDICQFTDPVNIRKSLRAACYRIDRSNDIESKDVLKLWPKGEWNKVYYHNYLDLLEMNAQYSEISG